MFFWFYFVDFVIALIHFCQKKLKMYTFLMENLYLLTPIVSVLLRKMTSINQTSLKKNQPLSHEFELNTQTQNSLKMSNSYTVRFESDFKLMTQTQHFP